MIKIAYKCCCMEAEAEIEASSRPSGSPIELWMELVSHTIGLDHAARSPRCRARAMEYAKIPYDEHAPGIGVKPPLAS